MKTNFDFTGSGTFELDSDGTLFVNDDNHNIIYSKNSNGFEEWREYDENGNEIHFKDSRGFEQLWEYDSQNNESHYKDSNGYEYWHRFEYDENNDIIILRTPYGREMWYDPRRN